MSDNIIVTKEEKESPSSMYKRFSRKMKTSGIVNALKKTRYNARDLSKNVRKAEKLRKIEKAKEFKILYRLGKLSTFTNGKKRR